MQSIRVDIRVPETLLKQVEQYQEKEGISNRTTAMLELIRIGLKSSQ